MFGRTSTISRGQYLNKDVPDGLPFYVIKGAMGAWERSHEWNVTIKTSRYSALEYCKSLNEVADRFNAVVEQSREKLDDRAQDDYEKHSDLSMRYFKVVVKPCLLSIARTGLDSKMVKEVENAPDSVFLLDFFGYQVEGLK